jgi:uncharacterized cupredoxin-like copper-binding protein
MRDRLVPWAPWCVVASALIVLVASCGSTAGTPGATAPPPGSAGPAVSTVTLSLKEYSISPATLTIHAGTPVQFAVRNDGTIDHALVISGNGLSLTTKDLAFGPGTTETILATLPAGTYTFSCPVDGHAAQGMRGTIIVTP